VHQRRKLDFCRIVAPNNSINLTAYRFVFQPWFAGQVTLKSDLAGWPGGGLSRKPPAKQVESQKTPDPEWFPRCPHCGQPLRLTKTLMPDKRRLESLAERRWQPP